MASDADLFLRHLVSVALSNRRELDELDDAAGDGDMGSTFARGAAALAADPPAGDDGAALRDAAQKVTAAMGGSSGPFLGVALLRAADALPDLGGAVRAAIDGIADYGGAERGDKTLLDALYPVVEELERSGSAAQVAEAARAGADGTSELEARRGRASYSSGDGGADPGAVAVALVAEAIASAEEPPSWEDLAAKADSFDDPGSEDSAGDRGFVAKPSEFLSDALAGFARAHADLVKRLEGTDVIVRAERGSDHVAVVSGGGSGHEPMHTGLVGPGMLDAAVPGAIFTSPAPDAIAAATRAADMGKGVLYVVKNYTGDVLNFRLAGELVSEDGIKTETVIVDDDVALDRDTATGRRGTGVTIVAEKIAGAAAARGDSLSEVAALASRVVERGRSYGVALHSDEMELGVGIHGEPGRDRVSTESADDIARQLVDAVVAEIDESSGKVLVLLSGLGGTPPLELYALYEHVASEIEGKGLEISRSLVGDWITSLDQPGAVLSLVALDDELTKLWDAPAQTPAFSS